MNRFATVNAIRKRAAQLFDGAPPAVEEAEYDYPVRTAFRELAAGTLREFAPAPAQNDGETTKGDDDGQP